MDLLVVQLMQEALVDLLPHCYVTKIKAAYPGYMWGLAYYSHVERTFQTASYYWRGGGVVVSINSFIKTTTLYWNPCTKRACICVLGVSILHLCTIFLLDFGTVPTQKI
jgi:hypothetical protein